MNIGILGSNGHVGHSLAMTAKERGVPVFEFCRKYNNFDEWQDCNLDVIINCVGMGSPPRIRKEHERLFELSDHIDNKILEYMRGRDLLYIFISSGAIHYRDDPYAIAKRCAELKHRTLADKKIVDIRVFNYLTEYINLSDGYLLTELINSIIDKKPFLTNNIDIRKDVNNRFDLWQAIELIINAPGNAAHDLYSKAPIGKFELLNFCQKYFGLEWRIEGEGVPTPTNYFATEFSLATKGYSPCWSSTDCLWHVINEFLK